MTAAAASKGGRSTRLEHTLPFPSGADDGIGNSDGTITAQLPADRGRAAPRRASGAVAARQVDRPQMCSTLPMSRRAKEGFPAPERAVVTESHTVPSENNRRRFRPAVFGHQCGRVRTMVLHRARGHWRAQRVIRSRVRVARTTSARTSSAEGPRHLREHLPLRSAHVPDVR
jgi:hypothetical protein